MTTGKVKWFSREQGYGFIEPDDGSGEVFLQKAALEGAGLTTLREGQTVNYEVASDRGKDHAINLRAT